MKLTQITVDCVRMTAQTKLGHKQTHKVTKYKEIRSKKKTNYRTQKMISLSHNFSWGH